MTEGAGHAMQKDGADAQTKGGKSETQKEKRNKTKVNKTRMEEVPGKNKKMKKRKKERAVSRGTGPLRVFCFTETVNNW
jgi:hypothetical protein